MTSGHFIYIPLILFVGLIVGFVLGGRAARDAAALQEKKREERERRRAAKTSARQARDHSD